MRCGCKGGMTLAVAVLLAAGRSTLRTFGRYVANRFDDALEIVGLWFGFGPSLFVEFRATPSIRVPTGLIGADAWMTTS